MSLPGDRERQAETPTAAPASGPSADPACLAGAVDGHAETATRHMRCGMALMALGSGDGARQALSHFDRALALRQANADAHSPAASYDLAATWINRADALVAVDGRSGVPDAIRSLDAAIQVLEPLASAEQRPFAYRLAVALHNRAQLRLRCGGDVWRVVPELFRALDIISPDDTADGRLAEAAIWTTLAEAQLREPVPPAWQRAIESAERALAITSSVESAEPLAATIGLRARHLVCRACLQCLGEREAAGARAADAHDRDWLVLLAQLRDAAERGERLAEAWQQRYPDEFQLWGTEFSRVRQALVSLSPRPAVGP